MRRRLSSFCKNNNVFVIDFFNFVTHVKIFGGWTSVLNWECLFRGVYDFGFYTSLNIIFVLSVLGVCREGPIVVRSHCPGFTRGTRDV